MNHSLQLRLSLWLAGCIVLVTLGSVAMSFELAFHEANEFQDDQLRQVAILVNDQHLGQTPGNAKSVLTGDDDTRVIVQMLMQRRADEVNQQGDSTLSLPHGLPDGVQTVTIGDVDWRVFIKPLANGVRVAVSQPTSVRNEIAADSALRTLIPLLLLLPLLLILVGMLIKQMFRPVKVLALSLDTRPEQELGLLDESNLPLEIKPFVAAINRLLSRVERSVNAQRRFVADAAHELRSPLTALSLQAERLAEADMPMVARERVTTLRQGIARTQALINQLLTLARIQEGRPYRHASVSLQRIIRLVLEDLILQAEQKKIDVGIANEVDINIMADEMELKILLKNLIDNAIRYTPENGRVDMSIGVTEGLATLLIVDTGPGIQEGDRQCVFDAFFRVLGNEQAGSGLGLSIAKTAADNMDAAIELGHANPCPPYGLSVVVKFKQFSAHPSPNSWHPPLRK
ncbi:sensor histidine kinase [Herbaspirillum lusitanum]|uniref:sensor histidine kinase n=1 Tax=Herbaspirillum lusitanum TaxID=213312 RepID=UPI0022376CE5|nr:ATP-binding protein [Herbaspirillum lusitanum]